jgi:muconolactone delta-isomerase
MPSKSLLLFLVAILVALPASLPAQQTSKASTSESEPSWQLTIKARREQLIQQNGPGTDAALRNQLLVMRDKDQAVRGFAGGKQVSGMTPDMLAKMPGTDAELTSELKQIVDQKGWPTIWLVGIDASNAAMLVLTHSADHAWQAKLLPRLEQLADASQIDASSLALVVDKELVSEGKLQRYGTQFKFVNGEMAMFGVEDPGGLDHIRARALLPPMDVYKQMLSQIYHVKAGSAIVSATPSAAK